MKTAYAIGSLALAIALVGKTLQVERLKDQNNELWRLIDRSNASLRSANSSLEASRSAMSVASEALVRCYHSGGDLTLDITRVTAEPAPALMSMPDDVYVQWDLGVEREPQ
jgi:hypothetical protein